MRPVLKAVVAAFALAMLAAPAAAAQPGWAGTEAGKPALGGHDPVSYFNGAPVAGSPEFALVHEGATLLFATAENRARFAADPKAFAPQYRGFCAWAASQKRLSVADPKIWKIVDGKLFVNCSPVAETSWLADRDGNIAKADAYWASLAE